MRVIIVEDELPAVKSLEKLLQEIEPGVEVLQRCDSVSAAVRWFEGNRTADLAFMDIQLGDGISFEIFEKTEVRCPVIFVTAYDEYAIRAFKLNSIDYLLKPVDRNELAYSLRKFKSLHPAHSGASDASELRTVLQSIRLHQPVFKSRFLIQFRDQYISIPVGDAGYFFSEHKNTYIVTRDQKRHLVSYTLEQLEDELDPQLFFRVNRQFLVSYRSIAAIHSHFNGKLKIYLRGSDEEVIISRERAAGFKAWMDR